MSEAVEALGQASAYQSELQGGFRGLRFARQIEHQFRQEFALQHLRRLRRGFGVALVLYGTFALLRLHAETGVAAGWSLKLRFVALAAMLATLAATTWRKLWPLLPAFSMATYGVFAIVVTALEVIAHRAGLEHHYESLILVSFHVYVFSGLLFRPAAATGAFIFMAYLVGGWAGGMASREWGYQLLFIGLTHLIGATALYSIERVERDSFLRRCLLLLLATRDPLTGLYNRAAFFGQFDRAQRLAQREGRAIGVVLLDIDHFKAYNDRYGHLEGDACLRAVGDALREHFKRPMDAIGRYGGEEFIGVWHDIQPRALRELAEALRASVQALKIAHEAAPSGRVTISIGAVAGVPQEDDTLQGFVHRADQALYDAKEKGRNRVAVEILPSAQSAPRPGGRRAPSVSAG